MADINRVILVGRLTRDAELRYTNTGLPISKFGLAINRRRKKDDQWIEEANFFNVVVWGKSAESLQPYLTKGKQVGVEGELRQNRWEQDGQTRSTVEIMATNIQLLGGQGQGQGQSQGRQQGGGYQSSGYSSNDMNRDYGPMGGPIDDFEDDIPF